MIKSGSSLFKEMSANIILSLTIKGLASLLTNPSFLIFLQRSFKDNNKLFSPNLISDNCLETSLVIYSR